MSGVVMLGRIIDRAEFALKHLHDEEEDLQWQYGTAEVSAVVAEKAREHVSSSASFARTEICSILEGLVNTALEEVFPEEGFSFKVTFAISYGKTSVEFELIQDGQAMDIVNACGGGVADIVSFMLRIACIYLSGSRRILIADEPFKFLSEDKRPMLYNCLKDLCRQYGMNVLMVSHDRLAVDYADRHYRVAKSGKDSITTYMAE